MFIPIGDEPNLRGVPYINFAIIAANVAVFLIVSLPLTAAQASLSDPQVVEYVRLMARESGASERAIWSQTSAYDVFVFVHGFKAAAPQLVDLFASMFLHAGWLHLIGNMLFLWIFGDNVELHVGRLGYLAIYLLTGVAATSLYAAFAHHSYVPMVGASGAISGVLGCYFLWFPRNRVRVFALLGFYMNVLLLPARLVLGAYLVLDNLLPFLFSHSSTGVAYGAHIGGFGGGLVCAYMVNRMSARGRLSRSVSSQSGSQAPVEGSAREAFAALVSRGDGDRALRQFVELPSRERATLDDSDVLELADWLVTRGQLDAGLALLQRFIFLRPKSDLLPRAHLRAALIHLKLQRNPAAYQHFLTVLDLDAREDEKQAARAGLAEVERRERSKQRLRPH